MIDALQCFHDMINAPARTIKARVELYDGSTLLDTFTYDGALMSFEVDRMGEESKFFGYGVCQRLTVQLRDKERKINIVKGQGLEVVVGVGCEYLYTCPIFFVDNVQRDENTNALTIIAYDAIYRANHHTVKELELTESYTIKTFLNTVAAFLGMPVKVINKNLLNLNKCVFTHCTLNDDGSITSNIQNFYYTMIATTELNDLLIRSKGKPFTLSFGKSIADRQCTIVIHGTRTDGNAYQEASAFSDHVTMVVDDEFTSIDKLELRFNRLGSTFTDTTTTVPYIQFEEGNIATTYEPYIVAFDTLYPSGANFEGSETLRDALNAVAEATQTIYYMNHNWELTFKRLDRNGDPVTTISKANYFTLQTKISRNLETIVSSNELGDDVYVTTGKEGSKQFVRNNPFWDLRDDIGALLESAITAIGGLSITEFDLNWRYNFLLEIGDKVAIETKDGSIVTTYLLNDVFKYSGGLNGTSKWAFIDNAGESMGNPTTIGEAIKQTYARVDKVNKQIDLVASEVSANGSAIAALQINTNSISASVKDVQKNINSSIDSINGEMTQLTKQVEATMTSDQVTLQIKSELSNGVDKVTTTTGFKFDEEGLLVSKSGSEMTTQITEDGMQVFRDSTAVLTANNEGVNAVNLHATTYLIIGNNSRIEDFGNRSACFWIGGDS